MDNRWGFRMHVTPLYSAEELQERKKQIFTNHTQLIKNMNNWTLEQDEVLTEMVCEYCSMKVINPLDLFPGDFVPSEKLLMKYSKLSHVSESYLQIRFYLLQSFNEMVKDGLSFFNISTKPGYRLCSMNKWIVFPGWRMTCERFVDYCSDPSNLIGSIKYVFLWRS